MHKNPQTLPLDVLESKIRFAYHKGCITFLENYIEQIKTLLCKQYQNQHKFLVLERCAYLLFDTVIDQKNSHHWRAICFQKLSDCIVNMKQFAYCKQTIQKAKIMDLRLSIATAKLQACSIIDK